MSHTTQGTLLLSRLGIGFTLHPYAYDPEAPRIGLHAAESLGIDPSQTFKTLMAEVDGKPVCVVVPSDAEVSMKKLAALFGGKSAAMMKVPDAERLTGYKVGGIGPFGQKKPVPPASETDILVFPRDYFLAGFSQQNPLLVFKDAIRAADGKLADLLA